MSNSVPQYKYVNRFDSAWQELEDAIRDIVKGQNPDIEAVWTFSGAIFRDKQNPAGETPEEDFEDVIRLPWGAFGIPDATYKIVAWFDKNARFQARAYVFEQPHEETGLGDSFKLKYSAGNTKDDLYRYIVKIDEVEKRIGVDFFPMLKDNIESIVEGKKFSSLWGDD